MEVYQYDNHCTFTNSDDKLYHYCCYIFKPFSSYVQISWENGAQNPQKSCHLNFDVKFEFGDLKNAYDSPLLQRKRIRVIYPKNASSKGILDNSNVS